MNKPDAMSHERASELLPWLVNDTLADDEKQSLLDHSRICLVCRREIAELELLRDSLAVELDDAEIPEPDMRRLNRRIDDFEARRQRIPEALQTLRARFSSPLRVAVAVQSLIIVVLVALLVVDRDEPAIYTTLSDATTLPAGNYLRIVVSADLPATAWENLLDRHGLTAVEGPSGRGVATLAYSDELSASARERILADVAEDPAVRFVQPLTVNRP